MLLNVLSEVCWNFYQSGRPKATNRSFDKKDLSQFLRTAVSNIMRVLYYNNKKMGGEDSGLISPLLSIQKFPLSDPNQSGMRRADMIKFDLYRLPHDGHITNVYPLGCEGENKAISLVEAGEEYFYLKPKFKSFKFGVVKGRGINTYNLPPCVKSLEVESTFEGDGIDVDISLDIAYDAANEVLGRVIGLPDFINKGTDNPYSVPQKNLKQRLGNQQTEPQT